MRNGLKLLSSLALISSLTFCNKEKQMEKYFLQESELKYIQKTPFIEEFETQKNPYILNETELKDFEKDEGLENIGQLSIVKYAFSNKQTRDSFLEIIIKFNSKEEIEKNIENLTLKNIVFTKGETAYLFQKLDSWERPYSKSYINLLIDYQERTGLEMVANQELKKLNKRTKILRDLKRNIMKPKLKPKFQYF